MYDFEYYTKENFIKKLDNAILFKYGNSTNDTDIKRNKAFYDDFERKYPNDIDIRQATRSWRSFSKNNLHRLPKITQLMQICEILNCDIDYFLTEQVELRKDIANSSAITGLKYESIDFLNTISKNQSPLVKITLQFLDLVLTSKDNFNDIITTLACIVFHLDDDESDQIISTYDEDNENARYFLSETNLKDYYLNYGNKYYNDSMRLEYYDNMLLLEINKALERLKKQEQLYRKSYKGNVDVIILEEDYENSDNSLFSVDDERTPASKDITVSITRQKMNN